MRLALLCLASFGGRVCARDGHRDAVLLALSTRAGARRRGDWGQTAVRSGWQGAVNYTNHALVCSLTSPSTACLPAAESRLPAEIERRGLPILCSLRLPARCSGWPPSRPGASIAVGNSAGHPSARSKATRVRTTPPRAALVFRARHSPASSADFLKGTGGRRIGHHTTKGAHGHSSSLRSSGTPSLPLPCQADMSFCLTARWRSRRPAWRASQCVPRSRAQPAATWHSPCAHPPLCSSRPTCPTPHPT